jgi:hypothetical protein
MRGRIRRRVVETDIERKILTGMIVSTNYCSDISGILNIHYFRTPYSKKIAQWVLHYFKRYKSAPGKSIKDIYEAEQETLKQEDAELIRNFLKELSSKYEEEKPDSIENNLNPQYLFDQTLEYFKERALTLHYEGIQSLLTIGKIKEAEELVRKYREVARSTSEWFNPFDNKTIDKVFDNKDLDNLFKFPGALGKMIGYFKRNWLVGFMGPMKRGKSWWLQEVAAQAIMNNFRTVFISLEMSESEVSERLYKRISALGDDDERLVFPCFDCHSNQDDSCMKKERRGKRRLLSDEGKKPEYSENRGHVPCTHCRDIGSKRYIAATWFIKHKVKKLTKSRSKTYSQALMGMFGDNLRVRAFAANTANAEDIKAELDSLEYTEGFIPSVIVIDYADILKPEQQGLVGRDKHNETWLMLKNLSQTKHVLVVTGTQSSRKSIYKKQVAQDDTSEDIRKLAHVDMMLTLNQIPEEEETGIMRLGVSVHRHKKSHERSNIIVLTMTEIGQPLLDSEFDNQKDVLTRRK